jgi:3,4-dihydroxy-2-butanone 4-phosphate synthase/GTP cyclohydrolase II
MKRAPQAETLRRVVSTRMPTRWGTFQTLGFERKFSNGSARVDIALAIVMGDVRQGTPLLRIHSQCFTSEVLGSLRCDCREQLEIALRTIAEEGRGLVIYEHQEGRGIGLMAKLRAYALQDKGFDTVEANHALGFASDYRDFTLPAAIMRDLGVSRVRLLSNNPQKARALSDAGIEVVAQVPCEAAPNEHSLGYLQTKKEKLGHLLTLGQTEITDPIDGDQPPFATIEDAIHELRAGRMIVVVDDEERENEGDLTIAAEMITPEAINFMAMHGRGLICLAMTGERLQELSLGPMTSDNTSLGGTAFACSIDLKGQGVTTGISAYDRAKTIKAAVDPSKHATDFVRPGHIFPLCARAGGVLERRGQTEAAVDLAKLAGLSPAGVICKIANDDGTMARVPDLIKFSKKHDLLMITVDALAQYRLEMEYEESLEGILDLLPSLRHRLTELDYSSQGVRLNAAV